MSHVLDPKSVRARDRIKITNVPALRLALQTLGFEVLTDIEEQQQRGVAKPKPGRGRYRGHKTRHGRLVGDYPIPAGWTAADVDNNASIVARMTRATFDRLRAEGKLPGYVSFENMYDVGFVYDPGEECFWPVYDFADGGGAALQVVLGQVTNSLGRGNVEAYSLLMQEYNFACDVLTAQALGYDIVCYEAGTTTPDGYVVQPGEKVSYTLIPEGT